MGTVKVNLSIIYAKLNSILKNEFKPMLSFERMVLEDMKI